MYDAYRAPAAPPPPPAAPKKPFWTRPKVGAAGVVLGLMIGVGGAGEAEPAEKEPAAEKQTVQEETPAQVVQQGATEEEVRAEVDDAVAAVTEDLQDELAVQEEQAAADLTAMRQRAKKAQTVAVRKAVTKALADVPQPVVPEPEPEVVEEEPAAEPEPATDPDFGTCGDAKDAGYGPYYAGQDPEYDWYQDRDSDGIVCE